MAQWISSLLLYNSRKYQQIYIDLYTSFVDLTKAFDTVRRDGWWKRTAKDTFFDMV